MSPLIRRNVELEKPLRISSWRKVAIGTWKTAGDPSVYASLDIPVKPALAYMEKIKQTTGKRVTMTHFVGKAMAMTLERHPDINCILRFGRLYPRKSIDIFFQVASDSGGKDLSGTTIRETNRKSITEIADEMQNRIHSIRVQGDPEFKRMKRSMGLVPGFLIRHLIDLVGFIMYGLNLWSPLLGSPKDPFGSIMITNIGSLGLDSAYAPIVPYSRVPLLMSLGSVKDSPVAIDGQVQIAPMMRVCVTFDHRLIDGMHGSHMAKTFLKIFADPENELRDV
jgi:pyruvate dehydrogenase E2 component (dihydrolipoamide acetyltransferase)